MKKKQHIMRDGTAIDCNGHCRLCELLDPSHPDHDPRFLELYPGVGAAPKPRPRPRSTMNPPPSRGCGGCGHR